MCCVCQRTTNIVNKKCFGGVVRLFELFVLIRRVISGVLTFIRMNILPSCHRVIRQDEVSVQMIV